VALWWCQASSDPTKGLADEPKFVIGHYVPDTCRESYLISQRAAEKVEEETTTYKIQTRFWDCNVSKLLQLVQV